VESWISLPKILNHDKWFKQGAKQKNSKKEIEPNSKVGDPRHKATKSRKVNCSSLWTPIALCVPSINKNLKHQSTKRKNWKNKIKPNSKVRDTRHKVVESRRVKSSSPWTLIVLCVFSIKKNLKQQGAKQKNETQTKLKSKSPKYCQQPPNIYWKPLSSTDET